MNPDTMDRSASAGGNGAAGKTQQPPADRDLSGKARTDSLQSARQSTQSSAASSVTSSPLASREPSPTRSLRASIAAARNPPAGTTGSGTRSRKNSQQELSPSRPAKHHPPTAAPPPKTISAATTPTLLPASSSDADIRANVPQKSIVLPEHLRDAPRWPVSPRLRSPPPVLNKPNFGTFRKPELEAPSIQLQHATPPMPHSESASQSDAEPDDGLLQIGTRTPVRAGSTSTLETVQEVSPLGSPQAIEAALERLQESLTSDASSVADHGEMSGAASKGTQTRPSLVSSQNESGSDSGSIKMDRRPAAISAQPPALAGRQSSISTATISKPSAGKAKPNEGTVKTMTVETETVASIPQVAVAPTNMQGSNGSLRTKPSSETIRPKKEKKKTVRKQQAVQPSAGQTDHSSHQHQPVSFPMSGLQTRSLHPASSKADNFEANIASAVDEADTSDSEETFVYDSNPPDARDRPHTRFHSRTPSATSMASQVDRTGMRSIHSVMEAAAATVAGAPTPSLGVKKKKFSNTFNAASGAESGFGADDEGSGRGSTALGSARGTTPRHPAHIGLWGRNGNGGGNGHTYLFDNESPFAGGPRIRPSPNINSASGGMRQSPGPPTPRFVSAGSRGPLAGGAGGSKRLGSQSVYDLDDTTTGADDEHTPLIHASIRSPRSRRSAGVGVGGGLTPIARYHQSLAVTGRHAGTYRRHPQSFLNRMASCLVLTVMLLLVVSGAIGFMFATSQPLVNVELVKISNVIASEQELMFDMTVKAQNPNVVVVSVDSSDLEVFAKSPHAGSDSEWWRKPRPDGDNSGGTFASRRRRGQVQIESWPFDDDDDDAPADDTAPNMRLGTISELDQPFQFEGSFFSKGASVSTGGMRLQRPGNGTQSGTERWERILEDEFDLILKGVLKYSLPLSQRIRTISIAGRTKVKPNSANDPASDPKKPLVGPGDDDDVQIS